MTSLVWLRRDLRLHDHAALATALVERAPVQPLFIFDTQILARFSNPRDRRLIFIAETLCQMDVQLRARGGQLLVLHGNPVDIIPKLATAVNVAAVFSAEDFEPATRARDVAVAKALPQTTRFVQMLDHLMRAPQQMLKGDGTPYKVFTPFYKRWQADMGPNDLAEYEVRDTGRYADAEKISCAAAAAGLKLIPLGQGPAHALAQIGYVYEKDALWRVDDVAERLRDFIAHKLRAYPTARDQLPAFGTSRLSPYLRHGLVSIRECMRAATAAGGGEKWIAELAWREFYAAILFYFPDVVTQEFMQHYRDGAIFWNRDENVAKAIFSGKTGYPIVDAAMRELLETGTMHNRARMIVASFASKDLLLDWRLGEEFFAQHLMDYDLASNNGGWQWSASTGTDAAPYFRIFNPVLQSKRFDPEGIYIRRYVPELKNISSVDIHAPWESPLIKPAAYPMPMVDHSAARDRALAAFKRAQKPMP